LLSFHLSEHLLFLLDLGGLGLEFELLLFEHFGFFGFSFFLLFLLGLKFLDLLKGSFGL
jgi:hypothetical protein